MNKIYDQRSPSSNTRALHSVGSYKEMYGVYCLQLMNGYLQASLKYVNQVSMAEYVQASIIDSES